MQVTELKGFKSFRAYQAFHTLMLGLKMLPAYMAIPYEEFYEALEKMEPKDQERLIREAARFVELQKEEFEALASFCLDSNGVPYSPENLSKKGPAEIVEIIVAVCMQISKIKVDLLTDSEKKNSVTSP